MTDISSFYANYTFALKEVEQKSYLIQILKFTF